MMATEEDKTGNGELRCGVMRKMPGEGGATMHHRHIHVTMMRTISIKIKMTTMA